MDITSIGILTNQVDGAQSAGKNTAGASPQGRPVQSAKPSGGKEAAPPELRVVTNFANTNYVKEQLETIMYSFPPFFPIGSPQRIDLIKGFKGVQDEIGKSSTPPEAKQKVLDHKLTDASTDKEVAAALKDLKQYKDAFAPKAPVQSGGVQSSALVNLKI